MLYVDFFYKYYIISNVDTSKKFKVVIFMPKKPDNNDVKMSKEDFNKTFDKIAGGLKESKQKTKNAEKVVKDEIKAIKADNAKMRKVMVSFIGSLETLSKKDIIKKEELVNHLTLAIKGLLQIKKDLNNSQCEIRKAQTMYGAIKMIKLDDQIENLDEHVEKSKSMSLNEKNKFEKQTKKLETMKSELEESFQKLKEKLNLVMSNKYNELSKGNMYLSVLGYIKELVTQNYIDDGNIKKLEENIAGSYKTKHKYFVSLRSTTKEQKRLVKSLKVILKKMGSGNLENKK